MTMWGSEDSIVTEKPKFEGNQSLLQILQYFSGKQVKVQTKNEDRSYYDEAYIVQYNELGIMLKFENIPQQTFVFLDNISAIEEMDA